MFSCFHSARFVGLAFFGHFEALGGDFCRHYTYIVGPVVHNARFGLFFVVAIEQPFWHENFVSRSVINVLS